MAETSSSWGILRSSGDRLATPPPEKRRKSSGDRPDRTKGGDLISALPEEAIHRILSFLPVEDAARTSVLSKRWRFTWTTTTSLVFNRVRPRHHRARSLAFRCIVDSLSQHTLTSALKEFHVNGFCYGEADSPKLEEWLFAEQRLHAKWRISAWSWIPVCRPCIYCCNSCLQAMYILLQFLFCLSSLVRLQVSRCCFSLDATSINWRLKLERVF